MEKQSKDEKTLISEKNKETVTDSYKPAENIDNKDSSENNSLDNTSKAEEYVDNGSEKTGEWMEAYGNFIEEEAYLGSEGSELYFLDESNDQSSLVEYALYDMNNDGVPELFINNGSEVYAGEYTLCYGYSNGSVSYIESIAGKNSEKKYNPGSDYTGLFINVIHTGVWDIDYFYLDSQNEDKVVDVAEYDDYGSIGGTPFEAFRTDDDELYKAFKNADRVLEFTSRIDYLKSGGDDFFNKYAGKDGTEAGDSDKADGNYDTYEKSNWHEEIPVFVSLTKKSEINDVNRYVDIINGMYNMTNSGIYSGVGSNNFRRTEMENGRYYDELIRTVVSTGDPKIDELMKMNGYSDYSLECFYDNQDYSDESISGGANLIIANIDGREYKYYFYKNNLIRRISPEGIASDNIDTNAFLAGLYEMSFEYRWKFNNPS